MNFKTVGDSNLLGAGVVENEPSTPDSFSCERVDFTVNAKSTKSLKFAILSRKNLERVNRLSGKHKFKFFGKLDN